MSNTKLYTVCSRYGRTDNPDDVEAVQVDSMASWPRNGSYVLRNVIYWRNRDEAERVAKILGPHRPGAVVSVTPHDEDAGYIGLHQSPIR